jgi:glycosyltransferase involved in cell wall biosynthesis
MNFKPARLLLSNETQALMKLTFFFPCYNEERNISQLVDTAFAFAKRHCSEFEILIINDGSRDGTAEKARILEKKYPEVKLINHETNKGYGAALITGFASATKDYIFYTDGDGQFDLDELAKHLPKVSENVILSGYRFPRKDPFNRIMNAWIFNRFFNIFFLNTLRDIDCSFKIYPRKWIQKINPQCRGALIDGEMLIKGKRIGLKIIQFPVRHLSRVHGEQTGAKKEVILKAMKEFLWLWFHLFFWKRTIG